MFSPFLISIFFFFLLFAVAVGWLLIFTRARPTRRKRRGHNLESAFRAIFCKTERITDGCWAPTRLYR